VKNRNNDRSDASLQVNHPGDVHGFRSLARPPVREAITKMYPYHQDRAPWLVTKTIGTLCIIKKNKFKCFSSLLKCAIFTAAADNTPPRRIRKLKKIKTPCPAVPQRALKRGVYRKNLIVNY
jgi:hypothetical protein